MSPISNRALDQILHFLANSTQYAQAFERNSTNPGYGDASGNGSTHVFNTMLHNRNQTPSPSSEYAESSGSSGFCDEQHIQSKNKKTKKSKPEKTHSQKITIHMHKLPSNSSSSTHYSVISLPSGINRRSLQSNQFNGYPFASSKLEEPSSGKLSTENNILLKVVKIAILGSKGVGKTHLV